MEPKKYIQISNCEMRLLLDSVYVMCSFDMESGKIMLSDSVPFPETVSL